MRILSLDQLQVGVGGRVIHLNGGFGLNHRLNSMGIRLGKEIVKISNPFLGGPVTIKIDQSRLALSRGMANKIMVEVDD